MTFNEIINELTSNYIKKEFDYYDQFDSLLQNSLKQGNDKEKFFKRCLESLNLIIYELIITEGNFKVESLSENEKYFLSLTKQIIKSNFLIGYLIIRADYFDCQVLLRKQLESTTRLHELLTKNISKLNSKTPNTGNTFNGIFNYVKKELSEFTHASNFEKTILANTIDNKYEGVFNKESQREILNRQIIINMAVSTALNKFQVSIAPNLNEKVQSLLIKVFKIGLEEKLINIDEINL